MENNNNNESSVRGTADLSKIRSQSYDVPTRNRPNGGATAARPQSRAHFADTDGLPNHINGRPEFNESNHGCSTGNVRPPRPSMTSRGTSFATVNAKRKSMARTISSLSLYSNFAGERLDERHHTTKPNLNSLIDEEKKMTYISNNSSFNKNEDSTVGEDMIEEAAAPKASVGKAMFMFLKAFIGSGVLFLPKA
jgi:hypothetical protein